MINRASVIHRNILNGLMCMFQNKRIEKMAEKIFGSIVGHKFPFLVEKNQCTDNRSSVNANKLNMVKQKQTSKKEKGEKGIKEEKLPTQDPIPSKKYSAKMRIKTHFHINKNWTLMKIL